MKNGVNNALFDDLWEYYILFSILSSTYIFGSSTYSVGFRKRTAGAANNSHVWLNGTQWCQMLPNVTQWYQMLPNGNKWYPNSSNLSKTDFTHLEVARTW